MITTLREIDRVLETHRPPDSMRGALDRIPSHRYLTQVLDELSAHAVALRVWAHRSAREERERLDAEHTQLSARRATAADRVLDRLSAFGVRPSDSETNTLREAWNSVLDLMEQVQREQRILGDDPLEPTAALPQNASEEAKRLRRDIAAVASLDYRIAGLAEQMGNVDPLELDERIARIEEEYEARGLHRIPGAGGRPQMDPKLAASLASKGIEPWAPHQEATDAQ